MGEAVRGISIIATNFLPIPNNLTPTTWADIGYKCMQTFGKLELNDWLIDWSVA